MSRKLPAYPYKVGGFRLGAEMKEQKETPLYATLFYEVRKELDITWTEYVYLDMVYHLSHDDWCRKSLDKCGDDLGLDRSNVYRMRNRLIEKGLLKKSVRSHVKTTDKYAKRIRTVKPAYAKRTNPYAKRDKSVVKTHTKNNNRITKNNKGYKKAKEQYRKIKDATI